MLAHTQSAGYRGSGLLALDFSSCDRLVQALCNAGEAWPLGTFFVRRSAALWRRF